MATASTGPPEATAPATGSSSAELDPSVSPPPESLLPNTPVYEIASTPFRGKAFLAIKPLQPGDLILIESPLFVLPPHSPPRSGRSETEPGLSSILAALSQCTTEEREAYMALSNSFKGRRAMQRWIDGGLLEGREGDEEALKVVGIWVTNRQGAFIHDVSAVWRTFSRVNHSCQPNCRFTYGNYSTLNPLILRAVAPISPGDELTISYTDILNPNFIRTLLLDENYDFRCTCPICRLPPPQLAESDDNRKRLKEFPDIVERWKAGRTSGKAVLMEGAEIFRRGGVFDEEGIGAGQPRSYYWHLLFTVAASHGAYAEALTYARRFMVDWAIEKGPLVENQRDRIEMEGFARDPKSAYMWGSRLPEPLNPSLDFGRGGGGGGMGSGISSAAMGLEIEGEGAIEGVKKKKKKKKKKSKKGKTNGGAENGEGDLEVDGDEATSDKEGDSSVTPTPALLSEPSAPSTPTLEKASLFAQVTDVGTSSTLDTTSSTAAIAPSPPTDILTSAESKVAEVRSSSTVVEQSTLLESKPKDAPLPPLSVPLPPSSSPTPSPTASVSTSENGERTNDLKPVSPTPHAPAILSNSPPPSPPPSAPSFDPSLSVIAAPPVSVDITKDELSQLAAERAAKEEEKRVDTVIDAEGEWEKWPEEALQEWSTVGGKKDNGAGEKEVAPTEHQPEQQHEEAQYHQDGWGAPARPQLSDWEAPPFPTPPRPPPSNSASFNSPPTWRHPTTQHYGSTAPPSHPRAFAPPLAPHEKPRSKATQRKAARKLKTAEAAAAAASTPTRHTPGLPRPQPSSFAELVNPTPRPTAPVDKTRPSPPMASLPRFPSSTSSSSASSFPLPPTPDLSDVPASGWIRKSPIPSTPKNLGPPSPAFASPSQVTGTSSSTDTQAEYKHIVLATPAFLHRPVLPSDSTPATSTSTSPTAQRLPSPTTPRSLSSLALVEEQEEEHEQEEVQFESDAVGGLGLGLGAGPLGQLDEENEEGGEGDRFEDVDEEEESSAGERGVEEASKGEEIEGIEEKMRRMSGAMGGVVDEAFEDVEEDGGAMNGLGISFGGQDISGEEKPILNHSSSFSARPGNSRKKSVRFESKDQQEEEGQLIEEELPPPPLEWTNVQDQPSANAGDADKSPSLPPSPPESPSQSRNPASDLLVPLLRLPPFLRADSTSSSSSSHVSNQQLSSTNSALIPPPTPPAVALPTPPLSAPSIGEVVEEWLSSTQDWEKRASQRRSLIAILNDGKPLALAADKVPLPSRDPSPPPTSALDYDTPSTPKKPSPSAVSTSSVPRIQIEAPTPPPSAPPILGPRYVPPSRSKLGLLEIRPETIELAKVERTLDLLAEEDKRVVKANLERVKDYPRCLPLSRSWTLFYTDSSHINRHSVNYDVTQTILFTASSVATLCGSLKALSSVLSSPGYPRRPIAEALKPGTSLAFFLDGAEPTWENEWNKQGGRFLLVPPKNFFHPMFERLILLLAGSSLEQLIFEQPTTLAHFEEEEGTLVGVVANRRLSGQPDRVELWVAGGRRGSKPSKGWLARLKKVLCGEILVDEDSLKFKRHGS